MQKLDVVLYTRSGCHLCDQAADALRASGLTPQLVDIDQDPELKSQYGTCIPVVAIDGRVRFRGRVSPVLLARICRHAGLRPRPPRA